VLQGVAFGSAPILETFGNDAGINLLITKGTSVVQFSGSIEFNAYINVTALFTMQPSTSGFLWNNSE